MSKTYPDLCEIAPPDERDIPPADALRRWPPE